MRSAQKRKARHVNWDIRMNSTTLRLTILAALALAGAASAPLRAAELPYRFLKEIPIGGEGG